MKGCSDTFAADGDAMMTEMKEIHNSWTSKTKSILEKTVMSNCETHGLKRISDNQATCSIHDFKDLLC